MKNLYTALFLITLYISPVCYGQGSPSFDVRNVRWGMSKAEVAAKEMKNKPNKNTSKFLQYGPVKLGQYDVGLTYRFEGNQLIRAAYILDEKHSDNQLYVNDFYDIVSILNKKYGEPKSKNFEWNNKMFEDDTKKYGLAVAMGHLVIRYTWSTPRTLIAMTMSGDNFEVNHLLYYFSELHDQPGDSETEAGF